MKTNTMNASSPRLRAIARASGFSILAATTRRLLRRLSMPLQITLALTFESCVNRHGRAATS